MMKVSIIKMVDKSMTWVCLATLRKVWFCGHDTGLQSWTFGTPSASILCVSLRSVPGATPCLPKVSCASEWQVWPAARACASSHQSWLRGLTQISSSS